MATRLIKADDLKEGKSALVVTEEGEEIALFKVKGKIFALNNACPHEGGPLAEGEIKGNMVICPWHDWRFNLKSGECVNVPGAEAITYKIELKDGYVYLVDE